MFFGGSVFRTFFLRSWSSSSASWEPSWASDAHLGKPLEPKNLKKPIVFQGFCKCSFLGLWSSQWPSWTHLGSFLARSGPKTVPKMAPKITQKWSKKWSKKLPPKSWILRRFWAPIWDHFGVKWPQKINSAFCPSTSGQPMGPRKPLKNVKLSSKSGFSHQELSNHHKILT